MADPAGGGGTTVAVVLQDAVPPAPLTVAVHVVVTAGDGMTEPPATGVTVPIPLSMDTLVALADAHVSVVVAPCVMLVGSALTVHEGAGGGGGGPPTPAVTVQEISVA